MNSELTELTGTAALRHRAFERLTGRHAPEAASAGASSALRVLHDLASSPSSAADALALLHELQVYQVELELQDENLRSAVAELESALARQTRVYDAAPVALLTIDAAGIIQQLNLQAAKLFDTARDNLPGQSLEKLIAPHDGESSLSALIARAQTGDECVTGSFQCRGSDGSAPTLEARLTRDPGVSHVLVALLERNAAAN